MALGLQGQRVSDFNPGSGIKIFLGLKDLSVIFEVDKLASIRWVMIYLDW